MFNPKIVSDFVLKENCDYLIHIAKNSDIWGKGGPEFWDNRVINYYDMVEFDKNAAMIMLDTNIRCGEALRKEYGIEGPIYSDTLQIVRWFPGMEQQPHADDMSNTDIEGFDHRAYGSIVYLNDDYVGGETFYPEHNFSITPKAGTLALHPGDPDNLHGVTKIENNIRYTIASFWTHRKDKSFEWPFPKW